MAEALERQHAAEAAMQANLLRAFSTARDNGSLDQAWTPETAARVFVSMIQGLWADWLRYGKSFDLLAVGSQCIARLFASFRGG
jgi:hypothetical protein